MESNARLDRRAKRLHPPMHCYWGANETCPRNGQITSLGADGCFVKTKAETSDNGTTYLSCWLPTGRWLKLRGSVTYRLPKIGFGVRFSDLTETEAELLDLLLEYYAADAAPAT